MRTRGIYYVKTVRKNGEEKKYFQHHGLAVYQQDGTIKLQLDSIPFRKDDEFTTHELFIMDKKEN